MTKVSNRNAYGSEVIVEELDFVTATNKNNKTKIIYLGQIAEFVSKTIIQDTNKESLLLRKTSGESIPSHTPIALINNIAYKFNSANNNHLFAFVGFSTNGTIQGQICIIQQSGELILNGWGLNPNKNYLAGENGTIILNNNSNTNFTKVIGYALDANTLLIKDLTTTLK